MRIITKGSPKIDDLFEGTCHSCKARVEAKRSELNVESGDQRESGEFAWAICPCCKVGPFQGVLFYPKGGR